MVRNLFAYKLILTLGLLASSGTVWAEDVPSSEQLRKFVLCRNGKTIRTLRVEKDHSGKKNCVTVYSKAGKDEVVGEALNPSSCDDVLEKVQKALESAQWKCRDVAKSTIDRSAASVEN